MLIYKSGNILESTENFICHQVNVQGVMGGGLALQIANLYPNVEEEYNRLCHNHGNNYETLSGRFYNVRIDENKGISNCFTQKPNFDTDYEALESCFRRLLTLCKKGNKTICVPFKYGCGIANGDWDKVSSILETLSNDIGVDIVVYKLES